MSPRQRWLPDSNNTPFHALALLMAFIVAPIISDFTLALFSTFR
jgi:hypothetical protein